MPIGVQTQLFIDNEFVNSVSGVAAARATLCRETRPRSSEYSALERSSDE